MKKIFSFDRFVKYFKYDLVNAKSNFGLALLILGFLPLMTYIVSNLFSLIFTGQWIGATAGTGIGGAAVSASYIISSIILGIKLYGSITDKKAGSNWIMIPASTFEKFLSMILIVFVIAPLCLAALLLLSDLILSLVPGYHSIRGWIGEVVGTMAENGFQVNYIAMIWLMWGQYALAFLLGAIIFKKAKVGKTILWMFIISAVLGVFMTKLIGVTNITENFIKEASVVDMSSFQSRLNWYLNISWIGWIALICGGIYWRLKTIKH